MRWQPRESQKRQRELERQAKEVAKLSALEQARFEVETFESGLEILLSLHKQQTDIWDWSVLATSLPPHPPRKRCIHEFKAKLEFTGSSSDAPADARARDEADYRQRAESYSKEMAEWERMRKLARRILDGEHAAYAEALQGYSGLAEISDLGSEIQFIVHSPKVLDCRLKVNGVHAIPAETKTLTASGKLSVKPTTKARFQELYQDYVCSCVLRVGREVFGLLPIETAIITASVDIVDSSTGHSAQRPVLSVAIPRVVFSQLRFEALDPSDSIENFLHRGDVKASRKSGEFLEIVPISIEDLPKEAAVSEEFESVLSNGRDLRAAIRSDFESIATQARRGTIPAK